MFCLLGRARGEKRKKQGEETFPDPVAPSSPIFGGGVQGGDTRRLVEVQESNPVQKVPFRVFSEHSHNVAVLPTCFS